MRRSLPVCLGLALLASLCERAAGATFPVTNTNDTGAGSLRQAITSANGTVTADTISFNIAGAGVHTITPASPLPELMETVTIDGDTSRAPLPTRIP